MNDAAKRKSSLSAGLTVLRAFLLIIACSGLNLSWAVRSAEAETRVWAFAAQPEPASGQLTFASPSFIGENYDVWSYDALGSFVAAESGAATWNEFQAATRGQFATRAEAGRAWTAYKDANGIVTGTTRSMAARSEYLRSLADNPNTASWMKPWLQEGRVPPGYEVDHIKPLSIGGPDTPANMRLQGADLHDIHHRYYRPWE